MSETVFPIPLRELVGISKGKKPQSISAVPLDNSYLPYVLIESFGGAYNQFTNDNTCRLVTQNDIIIVWDGERAGLVSKGHEGYLGSTLASVSLTNNSFDGDYIFYSLQERQKHLRQGAEGTGVPHLSRWMLDNIPILPLPLAEQKKIASILTSVDEVIENTRNQIDKLQDLKKATMNELLTKGIGHTEFKDSELGRIPKSWEVYRVSELLTQVKTKGKRKLPIYSVLIDGGMVNRNTQERRISSELDETSNLYVKEGNLAYNMMRMWQGASGIAPEDCLVSPAYVVCEPNEKIISKFLGFLLKSEESIQKLCAYSQGITSDRLRLYFEHFAQIKFAIPTLEEQEKIAEVIFAVESNLLKTKQILGQTQSLKKSLMQDLLTGKVRVQVN